MLPSKNDSFLDVIRSSGVDANYGHTPLLARKAECGVEVAALDRAIGEGVCLPIGDLGGPGLVRAPEAVQPARKDVGAVACSRVVAWSRWWNGVDQRLGDF